jgi:phosphonate transport system substrate-binding protein
MRPRFAWCSTAAAVLLLLAAGAARADWRDDIKVFRVGIPVGENANYRLRQAEPFRQYLQSRLGIHVELFPANSYGEMIEAAAGERIHYGIFSATAYVSADIACTCLEPVAIPSVEDGSEGYHAILVARAESSIYSLTDAKGQRLAAGPAGSVTGNIVPFAAFAADGIDPKTFFSSVIEARSPEDSLAALLLGEADVALAWSSLAGDASTGYSAGTLTKMVADGTVTMSGIRLIWQSERIPYGPHAIRRDLPGELKALVSEAILAMPAEDPAAVDAISRSGGDGMVAANDAMFDGLRRALQASEPR